MRLKDDCFSCGVGAAVFESGGAGEVALVLVVSEEVSEKGFVEEETVVLNTVERVSNK